MVLGEDSFLARLGASEDVIRRVTAVLLYLNGSSVTSGGDPS